MGLTFAVADLHGRLDCFEGALDAIQSYRKPNDPGDARTIVFLGDYVDRGPASAGIVERLVAGPPTGWLWTCLKGNHEAMMALALRNPERLDWWIENGGGATIESYRSCQDSIARHLAWIDALPSIHVDAHRVFVHGGVDPTMPLTAQPDKILLWKRYPPGKAGGHGGRHVIHGHDPDRSGPLSYEGRTALDTLAWQTGRLVVAIFDDDRPGAPIDSSRSSDSGDRRNPWCRFASQRVLRYSYLSPGQ